MDAFKFPPLSATSSPSSSTLSPVNSNPPRTSSLTASPSTNRKKNAPAPLKLQDAEASSFHPNSEKQRSSKYLSNPHQRTSTLQPSSAVEQLSHHRLSIAEETAASKGPLAQALDARLTGEYSGITEPSSSAHLPSISRPSTLYDAQSPRRTEQTQSLTQHFGGFYPPELSLHAQIMSPHSSHQLADQQQVMFSPSSYASPETTEFKNFNRNPHPYASPDASDLSSSSRAPHPYSISSNKPLPSSITSPAFDSSISSPISSPVVVDRTRLVGLGELATPRWTSNALRASREGEEGQQANRSHIPSSGYWNASPTSFASPTAPRGPKHRSQASIHLPISSPLAYGHSSQENHSTVSKKKGKTHGSTSEAQLLSPTQHHGSGTWEDDVLVAYAEKDEDYVVPELHPRRSQQSGFGTNVDCVESGPHVTAVKEKSGQRSEADTQTHQTSHNSLNARLLGQSQEVRHARLSGQSHDVKPRQVDGSTTDKCPTTFPSEIMRDLPSSRASSTKQSPLDDTRDPSNPGSLTLEHSPALPHREIQESSMFRLPQNSTHAGKHRNQILAEEAQAEVTEYRKSALKASRSLADYTTASTSISVDPAIEPQPRPRNSTSAVASALQSPSKANSSTRSDPHKAHSIGLGDTSLPITNPFHQTSSSHPHSRKPSFSLNQGAHHFHHHHHSPSTIAQSILKSASSGLVNRELEVMDMEQVAAKDDGTAEALRKLDGLSTISISPRVSRQTLKDNQTVNSASGSRPPSCTSQSKRRSANSRPSTPPSAGRDKERTSYHHHCKDKHKSVDQALTSPKKTRSRSLISTKETSSSVSESRQEDGMLDQPPPAPSGQYASMRASFKPPPQGTLNPHVGSINSAPSSAVSFPVNVGTMVEGPVSAASSPRAVFTSGHSNVRRSSQAKQTNSHDQSGTTDQTSTLALDWKRGSSSSTSYTGGTTSTNTTAESRDSTLATSVSASSSTHFVHQHTHAPNHHPTAARSPSTKRRSSVGSEASSVLSGGAGEGGKNGDSSSIGAPNGLADGGEKVFIPPVPPLPKDYETFKSNTYSLPPRFPSQSFVQLSSPSNQRRNSQQTLDSPVSKTFPGRELSNSSSGYTSSSSPAQQILASPSANTSATSATSRFLHSFTSHKNSDETMHHSSSSLSATHTLPGPSTKASKKWSLSAALGINRSPSFTKDSTGEDSARQAALGNQQGQEPSKKKFLTTTHELSGNTSPGASLSSPLSASHPKHTSWVQSPGAVQSPPLSSTSMVSHHSEKNHSLNGLGHTEAARDRTMSTSSIQTADLSGYPSSSTKSTLSSALSARRTPSGIPFFSRKSSSSHQDKAPSSIVIDASGGQPVKMKSPRLEKSDGEGGGRKSMLALNVFIRNSVHRKPPLSTASKSPSTAHSSSDRSPTAEFHQDSKSSGLGPSPARKTTLTSKASNLIGRRRGKTVSATDPPKEYVPPPLPPMQMSAIHPSTVQRVDSIQTTSDSSSGSRRRSGEYVLNSSSVSARTSRVRSIKESTTSIRRLLPTIDASPLRQDLPAPDVESSQDHARKENVNLAPNPEPEALSPTPAQNPPTSLTPTKIPRAVFRAHNNLVSPRLKSQASDTSINTETPTLAQQRDIHPAAHTEPVQVPDAASEFGVLTTPQQKRSSELTATGSLIPRTRSGLSVASRSARKPLNVTTAPPETDAASRLAAARRTVAKSQEVQVTRLAGRRLSTTVTPSDVSEFGGSLGVAGSRSSRTLTSKLTLPSRMSRSTTTPALSSAEHQHEPMARANTAEPERASPAVSEEEARGDEEMMQYVTRQRTKKLANGMSQAEVNKLFEIPRASEPTAPLTTKDALRLYRHYLSEYEKAEILAFEAVYYVGAESQKKMANRLENTNNFGYDDERGDYLIVQHDHLMYRYEVLEVLGKGSFGQVLQCKDHKTGEMVAIKIIRNKRRFHHQALVEIKVLENLLNWDPDDKACVLKMTDHFSFRSHLCIVNELLSINLYELIRNNSFNGFSTVLIRRFTIQILQSLSLLRHHRVVHCDLKPENILLKHPAKSAIKTIDFGSSCFENEKVYTYIQSRFYRSPEVILGMNYHMAIDMWSLGCILAELYTGYPIFPGETESEQLACIMEVLGLPDKYLVDRSSRRKLFFDSTGAPRPVVNSKGRRRRVGSKTLQSVLKTDDELFIDFIAKCLAWDPERRLKPDPAMRHPWIAAGRSRLKPAAVQAQQSQRSPMISSPRRKPVVTTTTSSSLRTRTQSNALAPPRSSVRAAGV